MKIINAENIILGRLASNIAKEALLGEEVAVINCEKAIISGDKEGILELENEKRNRKAFPLRSPKYSRSPDRMVRRTIRRMLPYKVARGKEAFKKVMCYNGVPEQFVGKEFVTIPAKHSVSKLPTLKYTTIGDMCKSLGGKV